MTKHKVEEKRDTDLSIDFTISEDQSLKYVYLKLYFHNTPTGNVVVTVKNGSEILATASTTLNAMLAELPTGDYHIGYAKFTLDKYIYLKSGISYTINLATSSYTFSETDFFGWCVPHEDDPNENDNSFGYKLYGPLNKEGI